MLHPATNRPTLLIIDDDPGITAIAAMIGRAVGFEVSEWNAHGDLGSTLREDYDVVILDLLMPVMDGIEVIERLAEAHAQSRMVLVSGQDHRVLASASRLAAAHGLKVGGAFAKPFSNDEMRACLAEQIEILRMGTTGQVRRLPVAVTPDRIELALQHKEIAMYYQPQVRIDTLEWVGVEALSRWRHPEFGLLAPDAFIDVVEQTPALGEKFAMYAIETALRDMSLVTATLAYRGRLGVNIPPDVISSAKFPDRLMALVGQSDIEPSRIVIEVTEASLPAQPVKLLGSQMRLRMHGISLAVDDFGTGHSGLERLHTFPIDELKIDKSFVMNSADDREARAIVQNSVALARDLHVRCVAEGVEDVRCLRLLAGLHCGIAQGYFIAKPMRLTDLEAWEESWKKRKAQILAEVA